MDIHMKIYGPGLGDNNTDEDNQRFAAEVKNALQAEYTHAKITVELDYSVDASSIDIEIGLDRDKFITTEPPLEDNALFEQFSESDKFIDETYDRILFIYQRVFEKGKWHIRRAH